MASILVPAFSGDYLLPSMVILHSKVPLLDQIQTILTRNLSSDLFTFPILEAHLNMVNIGAKVIT
jgi:hypothetical protein